LSLPYLPSIDLTQQWQQRGRSSTHSTETQQLHAKEIYTDFEQQVSFTEPVRLTAEEERQLEEKKYTRPQQCYTNPKWKIAGKAYTELRQQAGKEICTRFEQQPVKEICTALEQQPVKEIRIESEQKPAKNIYTGSEQQSRGEIHFNLEQPSREKGHSKTTNQGISIQLRTTVEKHQDLQEIDNSRQKKVHPVPKAEDREWNWL
jgi:hypothetical protein